MINTRDWQSYAEFVWSRFGVIYITHIIRKFNMASLVNFPCLLTVGVRTCKKYIISGLLTKQIPLVQNLCNTQVRTYRKLKSVPRSVPWISKVPDYQSEVVNQTEEQEKLLTDVSKEINRQIAEDETGRLFAIIHLAGKQYKITESDVIVVRGYWPPQPGDQVKFEKILVVGGTDFTLVGRPILNRELISIDATVIDKTFSQTVTHFRFRKRKQYRRIHFYRMQQTMVRVNSIILNGKVDQKLEVEGLDRVY